MSSLNSDTTGLRINSAASLRDLIALKNIFSHRSSPVQLEIKELDDRTKEILENKINRHYNACGCNEGKFFVFLFFLFFIIRSFANNTIQWSWRFAGVAFIYCMIGALVGKIIGKTVAHIKLRTIITRVLEQLRGKDALDALK